MSDCTCKTYEEARQCSLYRILHPRHYKFCQHKSGLPREQEDIILARLRHDTGQPEQHDGRQCQFFGETLRDEQGKALTQQCGACAATLLERQVVHACSSEARARAGFKAQTTIALCRYCSFYQERDKILSRGE